jgi:hypothetical protein
MVDFFPTKFSFMSSSLNIFFYCLHLYNV